MKIIQIPVINGLRKTKGVEDAPKKIIDGIKDIYSNSSQKFVSYEDLEIDSLGLSGDLILDNDLIYKKAFDTYGGEKVIFLGGDHSLSYSLTRAFFDHVQNSPLPYNF